MNFGGENKYSDNGNYFTSFFILHLLILHLTVLLLSLFILHLIVMTLVFLLKQQKQQLFSILRCGLVGGDATVVSGCHIPLATAVVSEMGPSAI